MPTNGSRSTSERPKAPGVIRPGEMYSLDEFKSRMRWSDAALRTARRNGFTLFYAGKRGYVIAGDIIDYVREHGSTQR